MTAKYFGASGFQGPAKRNGAEKTIAHIVAILLTVVSRILTVRTQYGMEAVMMNTMSMLAVAIGAFATSGAQAGAGPDKMYWADLLTEAIWRANADGTELEVVVDIGTHINTLALDQSGGKIYWADDLANQILRANLDGTEVETIVFAGDGPVGIALDVSAGKMYWVDEHEDSITRANMNGTFPETLVQGIPNPLGIALDLVNEKMYWTDENSDDIKRANLDGSEIEQLVTGLSSPFQIALDVASGKMYWTDRGHNKILRANLDGTQGEILFEGLPDPFGIALDLAAGKMYFTEEGAGTVNRANLDGSDLEVLITELPNARGIGLLFQLPEEAPLGGLNVVAGDLLRGDLQSLKKSDDDYVEIESQLNHSKTDHITRTLIKATSPQTTVSRLDLTLETAVDVEPVLTRVLLHNFDTGEWDLLEGFSQSESDSETMILGVPNPNSYVHDDHGQIGVQIETRANAAQVPGGYVFRIDHVQLAVTTGEGRELPALAPVMTTHFPAISTATEPSAPLIYCNCSAPGDSAATAAIARLISMTIAPSAPPI